MDIYSSLQNRTPPANADMTTPTSDRSMFSGGSVAKSGPDNQKANKQDSSNGDLREILTPEQQDDLVHLIRHSIDSMASKICSHSEESIPKQEDEELSREQKDVSYFDQSPQSNESKKDRKEPRSPTAVAELKAEAEAFRFLNAWRESVLRRLSELLKEEKRPGQTGEKRDSGRQVLRSRQQETIPSNGNENRPGNSAVSDCPISELPTKSKLIVLNCLLLLLISLEHYNAHSRSLLINVSTGLGLSPRDVAENEIKVAHGLLDSVKAMSGDEEIKRKTEQTKNSRRWKVGLASVAGAALIGVTGGLAAPFVAAGIGVVMGGLGLGATVAATYLGAVAGSSIIVGGIFGAYGARMTGRMVDRYAREVEDFAFLPINQAGLASQPSDAPVSSEHRLRVTICISGWLTEGGDVINPWRVLGNDSDVFALRWELQALLRLGNSLDAFVRNAAWSMAGQQVLRKTALAPFMGAVMWPLALSRISHVVDNPFRVVRVRADKAGEILADALINKAQGERPVTLIGYSMGARMISSCLASLAKRRAFGLVESAILIGSPVPTNASHWKFMRTVVSSRLINVYSTNDSILRFLYRTNSMQINIAGIQPVSGLDGVENYDVSDLVSGHLRYRFVIGKILERVGLEYLDMDEIRRQSDTLEAVEADDQRRREREEREERERQAKQDSASQPNSQNADEKDQAESAGSDLESQKMEQDVERRTHERLTEARLSSIQLKDRSQS